MPPQQQLQEPQQQQQQRALPAENPAVTPGLPRGDGVPSREAPAVGGLEARLQAWKDGETARERQIKQQELQQRHQQQQQQQQSQEQQQSQGQQQQGHGIYIMPIICDQCQGRAGHCNRQYPCCYDCDRKGLGRLVQLFVMYLVISFYLSLLTHSTVCTYTRKVAEACQQCRLTTKDRHTQICDRKVPRCSACQSQGRCKLPYPSTPYPAILSY